jgi:hypothetical protein
LLSNRTDLFTADTAHEILAGQYEADLGAGVCKKRIAIAGRGKSGSTRTLVAKSSPHGIFFMVGRSKNEPGTDFTAASVAQVQLIAENLQTSTLQQIEEAIEDGYIEEICHDC